MIKVRKIHEQHRTLKMAISPIVLLFPIMGLAFLLGEGLDATIFSPGAIVAAALVFILLSFGFLATSQMEDPRAMIGVSAVTCGLSIVFFRYLMQVGTFFGFLGYFVLICGLIQLLAIISQPLGPLFARRHNTIIPETIKTSELQKILDSIRFPCAFLELDDKNTEVVIACNDHFVCLVTKDDNLKAKAAGSRLDALLPSALDGENLKFYDTDWEVLRTTKGRQTLLTLTPAFCAAPAGRIEVYDTIAPETGLYLGGFMKYKARADIESINRGRRRLSVVLFHLLHGGAASPEMLEARKKTCRIAFGRIVADNIRACDTAYLVNQDEVLLFLPDTYGDGTDQVIKRIYAAFKKAGTLGCPPLATSSLIYAQRDFTGNEDLPKYDEILYAMTPMLYHQSREMKT